MIKVIAVLAFLISSTSCFMYAQTAPDIEWQKSFGGTIGETANSVFQTDDGSFVFAGYTKSNDGDVSGNNGKTDYWVVKMDASGNMLWQKSLGGSDHDAQWDFQPTHDGGYVIAGQSKSNDGDLTTNRGEEDYWVVRLDPQGEIIWQRSFGGSGEDEAYSVQQTMDGGFIVAGYSTSNDGDVSGNHGEEDYWIIKLDESGNMQWQKCFGGSEEDEGYYVQQTSDGGYLAVGESESSDGDVSANYGEGDYWVIRLDMNGNLLWQKNYGGSSVDYPRMLKNTTDNGFIIAGWSSSNDGDVHDNKGSTDYWIVKLNAEGEILWEKCLGGSDYDFAYSICQTADLGYAVTGYTHSEDIDVSNSHGSTDFWLVKLDGTGNLTWQKTMGGTNYDQAYSVNQSSDGGYIVAGLSFSNDGDVSGNHATDVGTTQDCWIVKLSAEVTGIAAPVGNTISVYPNPVNDVLNIHSTEISAMIFQALKMSDSQIEIFVSDATGRKRQIPFKIYNDTIQLAAENLIAGYYAFQIINHKSGKVATGSFVKHP